MNINVCVYLIIPFLKFGCTNAFWTLYVFSCLSFLARLCLPTITRNCDFLKSLKQWAAVKAIVSETSAPPQWCSHPPLYACNSIYNNSYR